MRPAGLASDRLAIMAARLTASGTHHAGQGHPRGLARVSPASAAGQDLGRSRPSSSPTSATSRSPTRPAWPPPATRSSAIRAEARNLTARGNLIGVVTNGTAVLGLGPIGPLAAKPVMEGKAVLFKKFAGIDCFDIEINERDPDKLVDIIAALEPTFGGINLEDIKAPECFYVERKLRERMKIPVFHDDQHGTAIIVGAAITQRPARRRQGPRPRSSSCAPARAPRRSPASTCWSRSASRARTSGSPTSTASSTRAARRRWTTTRRATRRRPTRARWPTSCPAPTSSSGSPPARVLKPEWLPRWPTSR